MTKGIAVKVFSELDMAAVAAAVMQMKNVWGGVGKDISGNMARDLKASQDEMVNSTNAAARAQVAAMKAAADEEMALVKARNAWMVEEDKRTMAQRRAILMEPVAAAKRAQFADEAAQANKRAADAEDEHAAAMQRNAAAASGAMTVFNRAGGVMTGLSAIMGGEALKQATEFEAGVTRVGAATEQLTSGQISQLHDGLLKLSTQFGVSQKDLTDAAYQVQKAGGIFRDVGTDLKFLQAAIEVSKIDKVPLLDVISGGTATVNDFNIGADKMVDALARMKRAAAELPSGNLADLSRSLGNIEPQAMAAMGQTPDAASQVMAMIVRMTHANLSPDRSTQLLNNALIHLMNPNGPQAEYLGGLMSNINMKPSDLGFMLKEPGGMIKAFQTIGRAIQASTNDQGQVVVPIREMNEDVINKVRVARNAIQSVDGQKIADLMLANLTGGITLNEDAKGQLNKEIFRNRRFDPSFASFLQVFNKANGDSRTVTSQRAVLQNPAAAWAQATGSQSGDITGLMAAGSPEFAAETERVFKELSGETADIQGNIKGWNDVLQTAQQKISEFRAKWDAMWTKLGETILPEFKKLLGYLSDIADFFGKHQSLLQGVLHMSEAIAAVWAGGKILGAIKNTYAAFAGMAQLLGGVKTASDKVNASLEAAGAAAQRGAAGVKVAAAEEIAAEDAVTGAAGRANTGLRSGLKGMIGGPGVAMGALTLGMLAIEGAPDNPVLHPTRKKTKDDIESWINAAPGETDKQLRLAWVAQNFPDERSLDRTFTPPSRYGGGPGPNAIGPGLPTTQNAWNTALNPSGGPGSLFNPLASQGPEGPLDMSLTEDEKKGKGKRTPLPGITGPDQIQFPTGTESDPLYVDPASGFKGMMGGDNPLEKFTHASGLWGKNGILGSVAGLMTTFLAELAFGNPMGQLAGMPGGGKYAWWYQGGAGKGGFGKAEEASNRLANAFDRVNEALARGYGPGTPQYDIAARNYRNAQIGVERAEAGGGGPLGALSSAGGGINLATIPVAAQKYANDCIDASARIILSHSGINMTEDQLENVIAPGGSIESQAAGLNRLDPSGRFVAMQGSGGSPSAMFNAIKASIDGGSGSILNVAPGSSIGGRPFGEGHFIAVTGYNPDGSLNLSDTAGGTRYSVSAADAFQATQGRGIVAGTGSGGSPFNPTMGQWFPGPGRGGPGLLPGQSPDFFGAGGGPLSPASKGGGWGKGGAGGGVGQGFLNRTGGINQSASGFETGASKQGFSIPMLSQAGAMAGMAADAFAPGSGALVQLAMQEANRGAQALGEAAATVAGEFPLETFFLSGKDLSGKNVNMASSFFGKVMGGLMGAHANVPNSAGASEGMAKTLDPTKTNPAMKTADNKDPNTKDGNNNNYGVKVDNIHVNNGQNMDDLHKGLNQMAMASPGGAGIARGQY